MARRKYKYPDRATAEQAYREQDRQRLLTEWFATALLNKTTQNVGHTKDFNVGYVVFRHSAIVYAVRRNDSVHRISGLWDVDDERLAGLIRNEVNDCRFAGLLETAKREATNKLWHSVAPAM